MWYTNNISGVVYYCHWYHSSLFRRLLWRFMLFCFYSLPPSWHWVLPLLWVCVSYPLMSYSSLHFYWWLPWARSCLGVCFWGIKSRIGIIKVSAIGGSEYKTHTRKCEFFCVFRGNFRRRRSEIFPRRLLFVRGFWYSEIEWKIFSVL